VPRARGLLAPWGPPNIRQIADAYPAHIYARAGTQRRVSWGISLPIPYTYMHTFNYYIERVVLKKPYNFNNLKYV